MVARQEEKSVLSAPDLGINKTYLLTVPHAWRFRSVGLKWGGAGRASPEGCWVAYRQLGNSGAGMWPSSLLNVPVFPRLFCDLLFPKHPCDGLCKRSYPSPGSLPHVMATLIPATPGECGAAWRKHAGVLPSPLPHLVPAPAGETAAAEEGRRQAFPQAQRLIQPGGFRVAPTPQNCGLLPLLQ